MSEGDLFAVCRLILKRRLVIRGPAFVIPIREEAL